MNITKEWLELNNACDEGKNWFLDQAKTDAKEIIKDLVKLSKYDWANWTLTRCLTHIQRVQYACYSAKRSLHLFEKSFPQDKRPRLAIKAAARLAKNPTEINRVVAARWAAWSAAWSAAESGAWSASGSARSAESAAWSAESARSAARSAQLARSARSAESAAWSAAESAAWSAAWSAEAARSAAEAAAWSASESARSAEWKAIIKYGLRFL